MSGSPARRTDHSGPTGRLEHLRPAHPARLASCAAPGYGSARRDYTRLPLDDSVHDPKAVGPYAYFSWYGRASRFFDLKNPAGPGDLTRFRPVPARDRHRLLCPGGTCTQAVWGVFVMPKVVLASDLNSGLWVLSRPR